MGWNNLFKYKIRIPKNFIIDYHLISLRKLNFTNEYPNICCNSLIYTGHPLNLLVFFNFYRPIIDEFSLAYVLIF